MELAKQNGIPAYLVFTNEELAILARLPRLIQRNCFSDWQRKPECIRKGSNRVNRGGSWNNNTRNCRVSNRNNWTPDNRNNLGLRLAL